MDNTQRIKYLLLSPLILCETSTASTSETLVLLDPETAGLVTKNGALRSLLDPAGLRCVEGGVLHWAAESG